MGVGILWMPGIRIATSAVGLLAMTQKFGAWLHQKRCRVYRKHCHCEPARKLAWQSVPTMRSIVSAYRSTILQPRNDHLSSYQCCFSSSKPKKISASPPALQSSQLSKAYPTISPIPKQAQQQPCMVFFRHIQKHPLHIVCRGCYHFSFSHLSMPCGLHRKKPALRRCRTE